MADMVPIDDPLLRLAVPGERLGWVFQNRNLYRRQFPEPPPVPGTVHPQVLARDETARRRMPRRIGVSFGAGSGLAMLFGCCGAVTNIGSSEGATVFWTLMVLSLLGGIAGAIGAWLLQQHSHATLISQQEGLRRSYEQSWAAWDARRVEHDRQQQLAVDRMLEWGAATPSPGTRRVDIVGGTSWGWEALLTVFGGSLLSTRGAMILVDFTGEALCGELISFAERTGNTVRLTALPSQLAELDLVAGFELRELVDCLVESMYGDSQESSRADRHQDTMLLTDLCDTLGGQVTVGRIVAGLRVLTDRPGEPVLTAEEQERVRDLWPDEARRQAHGQLRRLEAFLRPLESLGAAAGDPPPAALTCLVADRDGRSAQHELLKDLIVQWLIRRVGRETVRVGSILLVGADEVHHRQLERLSTLCERREVRLVLFFEHLREQSLQTVGGGEVAFLRLGNHQEAQQAAEFIGRQHKFTLTQLTRTLGGNETHSVADTEGWSTTEGRTIGAELLFPKQSYSSSRTRNWSQTRSVADGTNWSDATTAQRVYEYEVEPRVLQDLPDYALLLVKRQGRESIVQAVECDPAIVTLPRVTMDPLPDYPLPDRGDAVVPVAAPPSQLMLSGPAPIPVQPASPEQTAAELLPGWGSAGEPRPERRPAPPQRSGED